MNSGVAVVEVVCEKTEAARKEARKFIVSIHSLEYLFRVVDCSFPPPRFPLDHQIQLNSDLQNRQL
jgi:hypothetical protein